VSGEPKNLPIDRFLRIVTMTRLLSTRRGESRTPAQRLVGVIGRLGRSAVAWAIVAATSVSPAPTFGQSDLSHLGYDGFAEAVQDIMVAAFESGRVESVLVKVGDHVKAGQVLATLDQSPQQIAVEVAETLATMRGSLDLAIADQALYELRCNQLRSLAAKGNARPEEVARAEAELTMSVARFLNAKEEVAHRQVELKHAIDQLRRRKVISPIDGIVAKTFVDAGEYLLPSDLTVARVINTSGLKAVFNVPAAEAVRMSVGQVVRVEFTSIARSAEGVVETISPLIDGESATIPVTVRIDNSSQRWMAGDRCLMDPVVRPKPNRTSSLLPESPTIATLHPIDTGDPKAIRKRISVVVSNGVVTIRDLPQHPISLTTGDSKSR